ncbi:MAG TPA: branched-chain amino acid ABC transporter substrate-binding protein, partial [Nitrospiria bacterium]
MNEATRWWTYFFLMAVPIGVGLSGCDRRPADTIRIAVAGPMTGGQSKQGTDLTNGVELAVAEWNEKGG